MPSFGLKPGWYWASDGRLVECRVLVIAGVVMRAYSLEGESVPVAYEDVLLRAPGDEDEDDPNP